jgi:hypothetical protein
VLEGEVNHAIRCGCFTQQAVEVVERAEMHLCPGGGEGSGRGIRAGQPGVLGSEDDDVSYCHDSTRDVSRCHHLV